MNFAVGEIAIYWRPGAANHNKDVLIIGPYETGVVVRESWTGGVSNLNGHEIDRHGLEFGPHARSHFRAFAAIKHLRKKKPPGKLVDLTETQKRSITAKPSGEVLYSLDGAEQLEEA